jgi:2-C-methyl-D-erythritol 2,4-cyclodiphosphate synthase
MTDIRTGIGYDIHRFAEGRPLVLGGVAIPSRKGLDGHSDADVLLHAIADALLGAIAAGDIGDYFPPSDESIAGIASTEILTSVCKMVADCGFNVANVDSTIVAESPRISPYRTAIRTAIAKTMQMDLELISVKATTNERLGALGRDEGIAVIASVLLYRSS